LGRSPDPVSGEYGAQAVRRRVDRGAVAPDRLAADAAREGPAIRGFHNSFTSGRGIV
jgi:hypothetical protein